MTDKKKQPNEGEGNRTAARAYNRDQQAFVEKGGVEDAAEEAREAIEGDERAELDAARAEAKSRAKEHDPEEKRDYSRKE
jgi:hypothetical protein